MTAKNDQKSSLLLGAHMSVAGGYYKAFERGESIGCTAIQIFTKNNRQWYAKPISSQDIQLFQEARATSSIQSTIVHASYLINIASSDESLAHKSINALLEELERCDLLSIHYLVLHPGSNAQLEEGMEKVVANLDTVFSRYTGKTMILLENMAGQKNSIGSNFQLLAAIRKATTYKKNIGFCFDTCHAFAAGYDFTDVASYKNLWSEYDKIIGLEHLKVIHLNDSKKERGSKVDRHEEIGKGKIGLQAFQLLCTDKDLVSIPKILETPRDTLDDYKKNIELIHDLL